MPAGTGSGGRPTCAAIASTRRSRRASRDSDRGMPQIMLINLAAIQIDIHAIKPVMARATQKSCIVGLLPPLDEALDTDQRFSQLGFARGIAAADVAFARLAERGAWHDGHGPLLEQSFGEGLARESCGGDLREGVEGATRLE